MGENGLMPYSLDTIHGTIGRLFKDINDKTEFITLLNRIKNKPELRAELDRIIFIPDMGRMIAVSNKQANLATSTRYGMFEGMTPDNQYRIGSGRWNFARLLTPEEIANCF